MDLEEKIKYSKIIYNLETINNQIENLSNDVLVLREMMNKSIVIDGKSLNEELINNIEKNIKSSSEVIEKNIIPSLNRKKYS